MLPLHLLKPRIVEDDPAPHRFAQGIGAAFLIATSIVLFFTHAPKRLLHLPQCSESSKPSVSSYATDGKPVEIQRSVTEGSTTTTESFLLTYVTSGVNTDRISSVVLRRQVNSGSWSTVREADYAYYDGTGSNGTAGDVKTVTIKDGSGSTLDVTYAAIDLP